MSASAESTFPAPACYKRNLPHIEEGERTYFVTFVTRNRRILPDPARTLVLQSCLYDHGTKLQLHGAMIMPDHAHLVFTPLLDSAGVPFRLATILQSIKGASAHGINRLLNRKGDVWQDESFDRILRSDEKVREKVDYICENPVRRGIVSSIDDYPWLWREWIEGLKESVTGEGACAPPYKNGTQAPSPVTKTP